MFERESPSNFVFGANPIIEALRSGKDIEKIMIMRNLRNEHADEIIRLAKDMQVPVQPVPVEKLNRITRKNHQGLIAFIPTVEYSSLEHIVDDLFHQGKSPLIVILDRVTDVRNFGAIARSAHCAGAHAILIPARGGAAINADAQKASAGALNHIPVCRAQNLLKSIEYLHGCGIKTVSCTEKASGPVYKTDLTGPLAIIMGSEEDGISSDILRVCHEHVSIPMTGDVGSLNVSVATGIILYETLRQNNA